SCRLQRRITTKAFIWLASNFFDNGAECEIARVAVIELRARLVHKSAAERAGEQRRRRIVAGGMREQVTCQIAACDAVVLVGIAGKAGAMREQLRHGDALGARVRRPAMCLEELRQRDGK